MSSQGKNFVHPDSYKLFNLGYMAKFLNTVVTLPSVDTLLCM